MRREIAGKDNQYKAIITQRTDGLFEIEYFRRTRDVVPEINFESEWFWEPFTQSSITDTQANAEKLAQVQIEAWEG